MTVSEIERKLALLQHDCQSLASLDWIEKGERRAVQAIVSQIANIRRELTAALSDQAGVEPYLVWSNQHRAWWRANSRGYTNDVRSAGLYDREEAISISGQGRDGWLEPKKAPDELAIPLSALPKNIRALIAPPPSSTAGESRSG